MKRDITLFFLSILCAIFMCSACGNSAVSSKTALIASDSVPTITIRLPDIDSLQNLYLSEIADSVYYVALSDKPLLAGDNIRIETTDSVMVVGRSRATYGDERVRLYDSNGNFKCQIGGGGRGPGEYIHPSWGINSNTNRAYIYTHVHHNSLQTYDLSISNRNMISKAKNDTVFYGNVGNIYPVGDNIVISSALLDKPIRPELILYNPKTNTIIDSLPNYHITKTKERVSMTRFQGDIESAFSEYKNELYNMSVYSDTLYRVSEKEILPFAIFDFGEYKYTAEIPKMPFAQMRRAWVKAIRLTGIMRTSNMLYVQFEKIIIKRGRVKFIYAFNLNDFTGQYYKGYFINDLDNGPNYNMSSSISSNPNQVFDVATLKTTPEEEMLQVKNRLFPDNKVPKKLKNLDEFKRLWDKSTDDSNPIIQFLKLK